MSDFNIINNGSVVGFLANTDEAQDWIRDNVASEDWQWLGNVLWCDHRAGQELAVVLACEGFDIKVGL